MVSLRTTTLENIIFDWYPKPVRISTNEFVIYLKSTKQLIKYNTIIQKWSILYDCNNITNNNPSKIFQIVDWSKKTNFAGISYVGYSSNADNIDTTIDVLKYNKKDNKIFVHFAGAKEPNSNLQFLWLTLPNKNFVRPLCIPYDIYSSVSFDKLNNKYYIFANNKLLIININDNNYKSETYQFPIRLSHNVKKDVLSVFADNKLHLIGFSLADNYRKHIMFDPKLKTFEIGKAIREFNDYDTLNFVSFFYVKSLHILIAMNRYGVWRYLINENIWSKILIDQLRPNFYWDHGKKMLLFVNNDDKYALIYDVCIEERFYLFDLVEMEFKFCKEIGRPRIDTNGFGIMMDTQYTMIVNGYINDTWNKNNVMSNSTLPSNDIINLIVKYCGANADIHMLYSREHSKINVANIMLKFWSV